MAAILKCQVKTAGLNQADQGSAPLRLAEIYQQTSGDKNRTLTSKCDTSFINVTGSTCLFAFKVNTYKTCMQLA